MEGSGRHPHTVAATLVATPSGLVGPARVVIAGGRITAVERLARDTPVPGWILSPGFVDLQVNGIDDIDVAVAEGADWSRLDALLVAQGVTTWCPTLITSPESSYAPALDRIAAAAGRPPRPGRPTIAGAHLEGPFLGRLPGAHPPAAVRRPDAGWMDRLPPGVAVVTLGPEAEGAIGLIEVLAARGVVVSLGHSEASYEQALAAVDAGARLATHLFNAMGPLHHRRPGLVGAALADDRLVVSVIADGAHVHPAVLATVFRAKGAARVALVTDAVAWRSGALAGTPVALVDGAPRLADGTLAGSAVTMDAAVRNAVAAGIPLGDALTAASTTPAEVLGLHDRGRIAPGRRADLVALSPDLHVEAVWIDGHDGEETGR